MHCDAMRTADAIVMINGSFGVGKTTVAYALVDRLPGAMVFDPEAVGQMLRYVTHGMRTEDEDTDDFQDIALWPALTVVTAEHLYRQYHRSLIVPMTLANPAYFATIKAGLERIGPPVFHFCLTASLETVQRRLLERGDAAGSWPWRKAERCVPALADARFAEHIDTESRSVEAVVAHILSRLADRLQSA